MRDGNYCDLDKTAEKKLFSFISSFCKLEKVFWKASYCAENSSLEFEYNQYLEREINRTSNYTTKPASFL